VRANLNFRLATPTAQPALSPPAIQPNLSEASMRKKGNVLRSSCSSDWSLSRGPLPGFDGGPRLLESSAFRFDGIDRIPSCIAANSDPHHWSWARCVIEVFIWGSVFRSDVSGTKLVLFRSRISSVSMSKWEGLTCNELSVDL
jgi:hypothetical protein